MGWYADFIASPPFFRKRIAITIDNSAGIAGDFDVDVTIPTSWDAFWSVIDSAGANIRVTNSDGVDDLVYDIDDTAGGTFNAAAVTARAGRIRIENVACEAASIQLVWLYYDPDVTAADHSSVVTIATPLDGYIEIEGPGPRQFEYGPQGPRSENPRDVTHKSSTEAVDLWIRLDRALTKKQRASQDRRDFEEASYSTMSVVDTANANQTAMYDVSANRFVWVDRGAGETWLRARVKAGTDDNLYTAIPSVGTVVPNAAANGAIARQTLQPRVGISVRDTHFA